MFTSNHRVRRSNRAARAARLPVKELILFCLIGNWCSRSSLSSFRHNATFAKKLHDMHSHFILQRRVFCWLSASIPCRVSHCAGNSPPSRSTALTCRHTEPFGFVFIILSFIDFYIKSGYKLLLATHSAPDVASRDVFRYAPFPTVYHIETTFSASHINYPLAVLQYTHQPMPPTC